MGGDGWRDDSGVWRAIGIDDSGGLDVEVVIGKTVLEGTASLGLGYNLATDRVAPIALDVIPPRPSDDSVDAGEMILDCG